MTALLLILTVLGTGVLIITAVVAALRRRPRPAARCALDTAAARSPVPSIRETALSCFETGAHRRTRWPRAMAFASSDHLITALVAPLDGDVPEAVRRAGVSVDAIVALLEEHAALDRPARAWTPIYDVLAVAGGLVATPWVVRALAAPFRAVVRPPTGWVGYALLQEARRQAIRLGHQTTDQVHLLAAAASLAEQVDAHAGANGERARPALTAAARPGRLLRAGRTDDQPFAWLAVDLGDPAAPVAQRQPELRKDGPAFTAAAVAAVDRAAARRGARPGRLAVAPLVASVLAQPDDAVSQLLARAGLDLDPLRTALATL